MKNSNRYNDNSDNNNDDDDDSNNDDDDDDDDSNNINNDDNNDNNDDNDDNDDDDDDNDDNDSTNENDNNNKKSSKTKLLKEAREYKNKLDKRGVIYLSRIPPFMKPNKARSIFEEYGEVTRLFLQEEDINIRNKRKARGGNSSKQFTEGWIEYSDKKIAKKVALSLNGTRIGRSKGDFYHDDMWNIKYLKNFKWEYLTEKFAYERRVREQKLKAAMMQSKRTNAEFVELIEKQKTQVHIEERKRKRDNNNNLNDNDKKMKRKFHQNQIIATQHGEKSQKVDSKLLKLLT